eukprot:6491936-Amphidinium_carterae.1
MFAPAMLPQPLSSRASSCHCLLTRGRSVLVTFKELLGMEEGPMSGASSRTGVCTTPRSQTSMKSQALHAFLRARGKCH